jgi:hypothetical protein
MFKKVILWAQGRHTLFAAYFTIVGTILEWFHRLDANYIMLIGAVQTFVLGHSIKEDYFASKAATAPQDQDPSQEPSK